MQRSVYHVYEEWRGGGVPAGLAGDDLPVGSRLARLTGIAVLFDTIGGVELAVDAVRRRGGGMLDPWMAGRFADRAEALLGEIDTTDPRALVLEAEPDPVVSVPDDQLAEVAATFADLADLKTPSTHGHSSGVAALARGAGERLRLPPATVADLEVAGLLHDVGRVAVSDVVWEKPGRPERARVGAGPAARLPLRADPRRVGPAGVAGPHGRDAPRAARRRRLPPRLHGGAELSMPARTLAAADAYQAMTQPRPHRPGAGPRTRRSSGCSPTPASGVLDGDAVGAVLAAAGHAAVARRQSRRRG